MVLSTYVLLAVIGAGHSGTAMTSAEFEGERACENAANMLALQLEPEIRYNENYFRYTCEPKSARNLPKEIK